MLDVLGVCTEHLKWHWVGNATARTKCGSEALSAQIERDMWPGWQQGGTSMALCVVARMEVTPRQKIHGRVEGLWAKLGVGCSWSRHLSMGLNPPPLTCFPEPLIN